MIYITNGRVVDPVSEFDGKTNIIIKDNKILAIGNDLHPELYLEAGDELQTIDA